MKSMLNRLNIHCILSFFICAIVPGLVAGAAVMEFFIFLSCLTFFILNWKKSVLDYNKKKFFIFFLIFNFFLILSSFTSEYILHSLKNTLFYFRFGVLILIIWYLLDYYKNFKYLFLICVTITFLVVNFYSFLQLFILHNMTDKMRISGFFGTESIQGSFLLRLTPIFIILFWYSKKYLNKNFIYLFYLILILNFILIICSGERAAFYLTIVCFFLSFIFFKINLKKIGIFLSIILSLIILTITIYPKSKQRIFVEAFKQVFYLSQEKEVKMHIFSEGHQQHYESAILMFKQYPFFGVGVRNFRMECKKETYKIIGEYHCTTHPHNTYLQILSETGLLGFSFVLLFLFFVIKKSCQFLKDIYLKNQKINLPLGACYIIIFVNFFPFITTGSFFNNWLSTVYFLPFGFLFHEINNKNYQ
jgi:O-antigen ligase